jgi:hypothetical protein
MGSREIESSTPVGLSPREHGPTSEIQRESLIREQAFALAERRGFAPGHELDDWLAAEHVVDSACNREPVAEGGAVASGDESIKFLSGVSADRIRDLSSPSPAKLELSAVDLARLTDAYQALRAGLSDTCHSPISEASHMGSEHGGPPSSLGGVIRRINERIEQSPSLVRVRVQRAIHKEHRQLVGQVLLVHVGKRLEEYPDEWLDELLTRLLQSDRDG